jgi:hypothetical protein
MHLFLHFLIYIFYRFDLVTKDLILQMQRPQSLHFARFLIVENPDLVSWRNLIGKSSRDTLSVSRSSPHALRNTQSSRLNTIYQFHPASSIKYQVSSIIWSDPETIPPLNPHFSFLKEKVQIFLKNKNSISFIPCLFF